MMSGGIDSPVAGYQVMKQGMEIELIHFESTPLTPLESIQKVIDLAKKMARFTPKGIIKLHIVPFSAIHQDILKEIPDPYIITILRRMMYRIAEAYAKRIKIFSIINGESLGQVASQTIQSIQVVEAVTKLPIIRPLITWDKQDIINLSKKIDTYDISIRPFNDCCSIYVPKAPVTKPMELYANRYEKYLHFNDQNLYEMLEKVYTLTIHESDEINLADHGFTFENVYPMLTKKEE